jgi:serine/threonine-protein kinase
MIGEVVGNYRILEKIGEGGMGAVFKGVDLMLEREVAIKALRPELARQPHIVERFRAEAVTLAKLNHPNIATLHSFFRQGDDFFMVMEFVRGETLDRVIRSYGAVPVGQGITLFCQALEGIEHAHRLGVIHRDVKPANMMLTEVGSIKVMDFGIARVLGTARMTREGHLIGTIEYMSPEQIRGKETDARSDIYSLGILLYEMLTGRVPFTSQSEYELMRDQIEAAPQPPRDIAPQISLPIEEAIMRSLAKRPEMRFQTAAEFRGALLNCMRAATNPEVPIPAYVAPATRIEAPVSIPVNPVPELKETRLPQAAQIPKETRLSGGTAAAAVGATPLQPTRIAAAVDDQTLKPVPNVTRARVPLLNRLNWKHYTSAAVAVFILISVPFALVMSLADKNNAGAEVMPTTTTPPDVPPPDGSNSGQPNAGQIGGSDPNNQGLNGSRGSKPRAGVERPADAGTPPVAGDPAEKPKEQPPKDTAGKETPKDATAKTDEKKDENAVKKVGGFFKRIFKGDEKKTNSNRKKP